MQMKRNKNESREEKTTPCTMYKKHVKLLCDVMYVVSIWGWK